VESAVSYASIPSQSPGPSVFCQVEDEVGSLPITSRETGGPLSTRGQDSNPMPSAISFLIRSTIRSIPNWTSVSWLRRAAVQGNSFLISKTRDEWNNGYLFERANADGAVSSFSAICDTVPGKNTGSAMIRLRYPPSLLVTTRLL